MPQNHSVSGKNVDNCNDSRRDNEELVRRLSISDHRSDPPHALSILAQSLGARGGGGENFNLNQLSKPSSSLSLLNSGSELESGSGYRTVCRDRANGASDRYEVDTTSLPPCTSNAEVMAVTARARDQGTDDTSKIMPYAPYVPKSPSDYITPTSGSHAHTVSHTHSLTHTHSHSRTRRHTHRLPSAFPHFSVSLTSLCCAIAS